MAESSQKGWKTLWVKGEIAPFLTAFSKRLVLQTRKNQGLFGKGLKRHELQTHKKTGLFGKGLKPRAIW